MENTVDTNYYLHSIIVRRGSSFFDERAPGNRVVVAVNWCEEIMSILNNLPIFT